MSEENKNEISLKDLMADFDEILPQVKEEMIKEGTWVKPVTPAVPSKLENILEFDEHGWAHYTDLTELSGEQIGSCFSYYTNMAKYMNRMEARAKQFLRSAKKKMNQLESAIKVHLRLQGIKSTNIKKRCIPLRMRKAYSFGTQQMLRLRSVKHMRL